jgi:hypothetical protein
MQHRTRHRIIHTQPWHDIPLLPFSQLTIDGPQTILNNSAGVVHPGDYLSWTFYSEDPEKTGVKDAVRSKNGGPRRVGIRVAEFHDDCIIGSLLMSEPSHFCSTSTQIPQFALIVCACFAIHRKGPHLCQEGADPRHPRQDVKARRRRVQHAKPRSSHPHVPLPPSPYPLEATKKTRKREERFVSGPLGKRV